MIDLEKKVSSKWAKGFYHQKENPKILSFQNYKKNFNWISSWYQSHFKSKMLEPCLIFMLILYIFYFSSKKINKNNFFKYNKVNLILFLFSILLWLFLLPQFRFGYSYIILFIFLVLNFSFNYEPKLNKFCFAIIILSFLLFNLSNFQRVKNEFYKNEYFPFYQTIFFKTYYSENNQLNYKIYKRNSKGEKISIVNKKFNPQYNVKYNNDYSLKIDSLGYLKIISADNK